MATDPAQKSYSYLGPAGTFTEAALKQVPEAEGQQWVPVNNVWTALNNVSTGVTDFAMIAIENSVDGGVSGAQDALASIPNLRIVAEYLVPVDFVLVSKTAKSLAEVKTVAAHPVAYGQCRAWIAENLPDHQHLPASSNVASVSENLLSDQVDAAIAPPNIVDHFPVVKLAENLIGELKAVTRFVLVAKPGKLPAPTGADKTSIIVELPEERSGALLELLEQFSARGVNLTLIQSRPVGDEFGRYRFVIDLDGHLLEDRIADSLLGVKRFSPSVIFLGSYPKANRVATQVDPRYHNSVFVEARDWLRAIISQEP